MSRQQAAAPRLGGRRRLGGDRDPGWLLAPWPSAMRLELETMLLLLAHLRVNLVQSRPHLLYDSEFLLCGQAGIVKDRDQVGHLCEILLKAALNVLWVFAKRFQRCLEHMHAVLRRGILEIQDRVHFL